MDQAMKSFIERANIARYTKQIKAETDPAKHETLTRLLSEEEEKQTGSKDHRQTGA